MVLKSTPSATATASVQTALPVSYFGEKELRNLLFANAREWLLTNRRGAFSTSTLLNCNTRKYHGLLVVPAENDEDFVMLSALDETLDDGFAVHKLATHEYSGALSPQGYQALESFEYGDLCSWNFRAGKNLLKKELLLCREENRVLLRYSLVESEQDEVTLTLSPMLAMRNTHTLRKADFLAEIKLLEAEGGINADMPGSSPELFLQCTGDAQFVENRDWYLNFHYAREKERGYEANEDLFCPGYFQLNLAKGDSVFFSAGTAEIGLKHLVKQFGKEASNAHYPANADEFLAHAAAQFFSHRDGQCEIRAGFPWFGRWGRDTFIALPGLTLSLNKPTLCKDVLQSCEEQFTDGLFPNLGHGTLAVYNSADAPLWFIWAVQQYALQTDEPKHTWRTFGSTIKHILNHYKNGTRFGIYTRPNGLLHSGEPGMALTWMDAVVDGKPVTPRTGFAVELNALWYNAVCFALKSAETAGDTTFIENWPYRAHLISASFVEAFWDPNRGYLADVVSETGKDWSFRPNQIFAVSLPYSPLNGQMQKLVVDAVKRELLTSRGLRTLTPTHPAYRAHYEGDLHNRDTSYHQGTVWPWLLGAFGEAYLRVYDKKGLPLLASILKEMEAQLRNYGIGSVPEVFDGNEPHRAGGCISQAWSVAEVIRLRKLVAEKR